MTAFDAAYVALKTDLETRKERFPWLGGDLQTLRNTFLRPSIDLSAWPSEKLEITLDDAGDKTWAFHHRAGAQPRATATIIHGLGGDASGIGIAYLTSALLADGFDVVRVNLRAAPMVYHLANSIGHAGKTEDLRAILSGLEDALGTRDWLPIGISLGGNLLLKALGDGALAGFNVPAAMSVCAPIDMKAASDRILAPRNTIYARYLLNDLQNNVLNVGMETAWKDKARAAKTVYEFDDAVTGPFHGFGTADRYYADVSAGPVLKQIEVPTLVLHAADDPWIPAGSYEAYRPDTDHRVKMLIAPKGGHVGFHMGGHAEPAYCAAAKRWFKAAAS
ncbi:MAG: alpha/beta fold hydrolase [Pseudomonadota bacterium]